MHRVQRTMSVKEKNLAARRAKLELDYQRTDEKSIKDTDLTQWIAAPISWAYQQLLDVALRRFKEFVEVMGPKDFRIVIKDPDIYFVLGAQHISPEVARLFILYIAGTSTGMLGENITMTAVQNYIAHTLSVAYRLTVKKQMGKEDLSQVDIYIKKLGDDGDLSNKVRVKPVATSIENLLLEQGVN